MSVAQRRQIILNDDHAKIELTQGKWAIIDLDDLARVRTLAWSYTRHTYGRGYATNRIGLLHTFIVGKPPAGQVTDHINGDGLDCRKTNLRFVTQRTNAYNRRTKAKGVRFYNDKKRRPWGAHVRYGDQEISLGRYATMAEALEVAAKARHKRNIELGIVSED